MVTVVCCPVESGTEVVATYDVTGLTASGNDTVRAFALAFPNAIDTWVSAMDKVISAERS